jgi:hypothetical protein
MPSGPISIPSITLTMIVFDVIPMRARTGLCLLVVVVVLEGGVNQRDVAYWMKRSIRVGLESERKGWGSMEPKQFTT